MEGYKFASQFLPIISTSFIQQGFELARCVLSDSSTQEIVSSWSCSPDNEIEPLVNTGFVGIQIGTLITVFDDYE